MTVEKSVAGDFWKHFGKGEIAPKFVRMFATLCKNDTWLIIIILSDFHMIWVNKMFWEVELSANDFVVYLQGLTRTKYSISNLKTMAAVL